MTGSSLDDSNTAPETPAVSGETVRAWNPMLQTPPAEAPAVTGETVRARIPTPPPGTRPSVEDEPIGADLVEPEPFELEAELIESVGPDVPVSRAEAPTLPESAADVPSVPDIGRAEPPAVAGEVSVAEPEPVGMFDARPQRPRRRSTEPAEQASPTRADPPAVAGEVSVGSTTQPPPPSEGRVMTASGPQPVLTPDAMAISGPVVVTPEAMTASGPQPVLTPDSMTASGSNPALGHRNMTASGPQPALDPNYVGGIYSETTGPQPVAQAEITVPHTVMGAGVARTRGDRTLWYVALALVLLAVGGVVLVVSRAS